MNDVRLWHADEADKAARAEADRMLAEITEYPCRLIATTNKQAVRMLLKGNPKIMGKRPTGIGHDEYYLTAPHIGAGVYRVTATLIRERRTK